MMTSTQSTGKETLPETECDTGKQPLKILETYTTTHSPCR